MSTQRATIVLIVERNATMAGLYYNNLTMANQNRVYKKIVVATAQEGLNECSKIPKPDIIVFAGAQYSTFGEGLQALQVAVKQT